MPSTLKLEKLVQQEILDACEIRPELVEEAYDIHEEYVAAREDDEMRRSLAKRLVQ